MVSALLVIGGCLMYYRPVSWFPDAPLGAATTKLIGHKGAGSENTWYSGADENTLEGVLEALPYVSGVEIDVQMSRSGTLYGLHNETINGEGANEKLRLIDLNDDQIEELRPFNGSRFQKLLPILRAIKQRPTHVISLDVKGYHFVNSLSYNGYLRTVAQNISELAKQLGISHQVMVESTVPEFHQVIKQHNPQIQTFLCLFNMFGRGASEALSNGVDGLSMKYNDDQDLGEQIAMFRRKGLKIQLWTVNDDNRIRAAAALKPDFIQTDHYKFQLGD